MVIGEPDPGSFEGDVRLCGRVGGQEYHEAVTVSNCGFETLSKFIWKNLADYATLCELCEPYASYSIKTRLALLL